MADRRKHPRIALETRINAFARSWVPARLVDMSEGGFQLESEVALKPGSVCDLTFQLDGEPFEAQVTVRRCRALAVVDHRGRQMRYLAGAEITRIGEAQRALLAAFVASHPGEGVTEPEVVEVA